MAEQQKILIAEVSDNTTWYDYFPWAANVWVVATTNIYTGLISADFEPEEIGLENTLHVLSYQVNKEPYVEVFNTTDVQGTVKSWYFDTTNKWLYIHYGDHKPYTYFSTTALEIGFVFGIYKTNSDSRGIWNGQQYYPRLMSNPVFPDKKDDQFNAKQVLPSGTVEFDNNDLRFKNYNIGYGIKRKNGNFVRTLIWTGADATQALYSEFDVTYQGVIEQVTEGKTVKLKLRDLRSTLTTKSPFNYLDTTSFPDIKNPDKEYVLPELWGQGFEVPCLCLNADANKGITALPVTGSDDYTFLICDTSKHTIATDSITAVYIDGTEINITPPTVVFNTTQSFAYFTIPETEFRETEAKDDGSAQSVKWKKMNKVSIDCKGYLKGADFKESNGVHDPAKENDLIENGLAVLREIIKNNYGWDYTTIFYDITTWQGFEDSAYDVAYYLNKPKSTQKQIEDMAASQLGKFLWEADRRFSFDNDDFVSFKTDIAKTEMFPLDFFPQFNTDTSEVLSVFRIGYARKWTETDTELAHSWEINDSNKGNALTEYNSTFEKDFPTFLTTVADAQAYAARVLIFGKDSNDQFTITTTWDRFNLKSGDWVRAQADYGNGDYVGWTKCQIQTVSPKADNWTVDLKLRVFEIVPLLTFDGEQALFDGLPAIVEGQ
jgi:hypothetical protein